MAVPAVLVGLAAPALGLAAVLVLGLGILRALPGVWVAVGVLALTLGPPLGLLWALPPAGRRWALGPALLGWSVCVIVGFGGLFPGERAAAAGAGVQVLIEGFGWPGTASGARAFVDRLPALPGKAPLPTAPAVAALPVAAPAPVAAAAPAGPAPDGGVVLPYEGEGVSLIVPLELEDRSGVPVEVPLVFDTGATLTTLDRATLRRLGVTVPRDAPEITFFTANGERRAPLVLLDRAWFGGLLVEGVTVGVCDKCATEGHAGLLGLNVSRRFLVTVDQSRKELHLQPRVVDASDEVRWWAELESTATRHPDGRVEVEVLLHNRSARPIQAARVDVRCGEAWAAELADIAPHATGRTEVALPPGTDCDGYSVSLGAAAW